MSKSQFSGIAALIVFAPHLSPLGAVFFGLLFAVLCFVLRKESQ